MYIHVQHIYKKRLFQATCTPDRVHSYTLAIHVLLYNIYKEYRTEKKNHVHCNQAGLKKSETESMIFKYRKTKNNHIRLEK